MIDVADNNAVYYYHFDGLGSVIAQNKQIIERYSYDVFGEPNRLSDVNNPYLFTGRRYDSETALCYYRARYYDYYIGRFLQPDPIGYGAGLNLYTYCGNNPIKWIDPGGFCKGEHAAEGGFSEALLFAFGYMSDTTHFRLDDKYKHMYVSYRMSQIAGPTRAEFIGLANEVFDMVFGEGFNVGDYVANRFGIALAEEGVPEPLADPIFHVVAPVFSRDDVEFILKP
jgi:RHS repeat-associated protein